ncbi:MAG: branched-chain amino acid ABC transporter permease, partial [Treponema sp.]|nr:branched-chain amino acid ABC transporter permease [Treponema sp.]
NAVIAIAVVVSFVCSYLCGIIPLIKNLSDGTRTIILTVIISSVIAIIKPVKDEDMENSENQGEVQNEK